ASVFGTDASAEAIEVARGNARSLRVADRCRFECGDLAAPAQTMRFDAVLANLPYVPSADVPQKPDPVGFEPRAALDGGADGLALYRRFVPGLPALLLPGGVALMEAAPHQMAALTALVRRRFPAARVRAERDFGGAERYVRVEAPGA
ncbi:MAG TPA: hypothetical protein VJP76_03640, partial [Candidatus Tumulicola sp.]|nr:hypothetical protein [Candidatus Tumulicola sp.]